MNIGILIPGFGTNEDDWALPVYQNFARELSKSHPVRVIALRYPHTQQPYSYHGVEITPLGYGAWTKGINRLPLWWNAYQTVKQLHIDRPFDILHGIWADETGALSGWIGNRLGIPSVVSIAGGELVKKRQVKYGLQHGLYGKWIVNQALTTNTAVVSPYKYGLDDHLKSMRLTHLPVHYIPLGVDTNLFYPSDITRKAKHLISVGSLIPIKNQIRLLDTMKMLDDDITLDIIGQGKLHEELQQHAKKLSVDHRVNFLGNVNHTQLREHYSQAQLHIHTSLHEAFGMAVLEAAACGTPTIGTREGLVADDHKLARWIDNPTNLKKAIDRLLSNRMEMDKFQSDALEAVKQQYTIQHTTDQYTNLYQSLLNR